METSAREDELCGQGAAHILGGFLAYETRFREITRRAPERFANRDWAGAQEDAVERLRIYSQSVDQAVGNMRDLLGSRDNDPVLWARIKEIYSGLISDRQDWELAETFHNSISRKMFTTVGVNPRIEFVDTEFDSPPSPSLEPVSFMVNSPSSIEEMVVGVLGSFELPTAFAHREQDIHGAAEKIELKLAKIGAAPTVDAAEVVRAIFYRGQAAYIVGRLHSGTRTIPLVMVLRHGLDGVFIDALLLSENEVSILFSFTRSYFHVDVARPYELVRFLARLMPRKRIAEIYISIGQNKHGKTELYRDLLRHLDSTDDRFEPAPGTKGLVMIVFTMPGYDDVFKVIRDSFPPPKRTTRRAVMEKYRLVFRHDRAGRLMDVQDFQHLAFHRSRFDEGLLRDLLAEAGNTVRMEGDSVIVSHVYVERRIIPLDVYIREAVPPAAAAAVIDYGQAIKDLASTNIFPGDLLTKNFGVTRHGRVVFYDYDELSSLTDVEFREIPEPRDDLDAMSADPWFPVGDRAVFPEEHQRFLGFGDELSRVFREHHDDLFQVEPWRSIQGRVRSGELIEVLPYTDDARLPGTAEPRGW